MYVQSRCSSSARERSGFLVGLHLAAALCLPHPWPRWLRVKQHRAALRSTEQHRTDATITVGCKCRRHLLAPRTQLSCSNISSNTPPPSLRRPPKPETLQHQITILGRARFLTFPQFISDASINRLSDDFFLGPSNNSSGGFPRLHLVFLALRRSIAVHDFLDYNIGRPSTHTGARHSCPPVCP